MSHSPQKSWVFLSVLSSEKKAIGPFWERTEEIMKYKYMNSYSSMSFGKYIQSCNKHHRDRLMGIFVQYKLFFIENPRFKFMPTLFGHDHYSEAGI